MGFVFLIIALFFFPELMTIALFVFVLALAFAALSWIWKIIEPALLAIIEWLSGPCSWLGDNILTIISTIVGIVVAYIIFAMIMMEIDNRTSPRFKAEREKKRMRAARDELSRAKYEQSRRG